MTGKLTDTEPPIPRKSKQVIGKPLKSVTAKMLKDALKINQTDRIKIKLGLRSKVQKEKCILLGYFCGRDTGFL